MDSICKGSWTLIFKRENWEWFEKLSKYLRKDKIYLFILILWFHQKILEYIKWKKIEIKVSNNIDFENKSNPRITVVGVGGGGNNMVSHFARKFQEERKKILN